VSNFNTNISLRRELIEKSVSGPGTDVIILKIFLQKNLAKKWRFCSKPLLVFEKYDHDIVF
jgi:hypothetical protein